MINLKKVKFGSDLGDALLNGPYCILLGMDSSIVFAGKSIKIAENAYVTSPKKVSLTPKLLEGEGNIVGKNIKIKVQDFKFNGLIKIIDNGECEIFTKTPYEQVIKNLYCSTKQYKSYES